MDISQQILSDITVFNKYARYIPEIQRREDWDELCDRNMAMHIRKYPQLKEEIKEVYKRSVRTRKVLPSMRSIQFGGLPIELSNSRINNCFRGDTEYVTIDGLKTFEETVDTTQIVLAGDGEWRPATISSFGKQKIQKVTLRPGEKSKTKVRLEFFVTGNHRWITARGEVTDLRVGDIIPFNTQQEPDFSAADFIAGFGFGDGTIGKGGVAQLRLCGKKTKYLPIFEEFGNNSIYSPASYNGDFVVMFKKGFFSDWKNLPPKPSYWWFRGYMAADGYSCPTQPYLCSQNQDAVAYIEKNSVYGGYAVSGKCKYTEDTNYGPRAAPLVKLVLREELDFKVMSIEEVDAEEEVFCATEPVTSQFTLMGGVLTGNCAYSPIDDPVIFGEIMFNLLSGSGQGYSVQKRHVDCLPVVQGPSNTKRKYLISDDIEGWGNAIKQLFKAYFQNRPDPTFDYRAIRQKGARLVTSGGKAPGPEPLRICIELMRSILNGAIGRKLRPIECHDLICHEADAVLSGGIRRAACLAMFDYDDMEMLTAKAGAWWELNPQRGRANNSVVLHREHITREQFDFIWQRVIDSGCGEPGVVWTNNYDWGVNPCC